jgi:hydroxyacylglutathione hydrolase
MLLRYFYDEHLAQASYLVGCVKTGEALVVDPGRDIAPYLLTAAKEGVRITHVTETHIHADFVSGSRELAAATGATLYLSDMGDANWKYMYADEPNVLLVRDGDSWLVGNVKIDVIHTPGHTPEHLSFLLTDTAAADQPMGVFTGDFLFAGDIGRPDLLEEAAGCKGTKEPGARVQFETVQRFKTLPDYLQVWPGHGAGSACGKALGAIPSTTLGYEKRFNPAFQFNKAGAFVHWLLAGQPEAPRYFGQMKKINKLGASLLKNLPAPGQLTRADLDALLRDGALVVDLRSAAAYADAYVPGTLSVPMTSPTFLTHVGWFVDYVRPLYFIAPSQAEVPEILKALHAIGLDFVPGFFTPEVVRKPAERLAQISAHELAARLPVNGLTILDVRGQSEFAEKHVAGARHIPLGYLLQRLQEVPRDQTVVTQCASGYRSHIAASLLQAHGFHNVFNLNAGIETWAKVLPTEA